ncbi:F-box protein CPR1-like [Camellia sinensis]|uniref:F-box protein CPR1-like n=1 Tax=Camellia sinensis TaxID=4442 RepID=UPI0010368E06|nr:F-box protein CPR1-like [Camellia sinensis]
MANLSEEIIIEIHSRLPITTLCQFSYGLGYDSSNDDYKVVRISHYFCISDCTDSIIVSVGSLHWLATDSKKLDVIATFHLADENFQIMPFPTLQYAHRLKLRLGALDGCLRVLVPLSNGCQDVWVMKEYGVRDSWTKITIGSKILCLPRTGQVLFETRRNKLMLFDPQEEKCRELVVRSGSSQFEAGTYVESLVSPNWSNMIKRSLQAQMEACEAKNKVDLSEAKRYRLDE